MWMLRQLWPLRHALVLELDREYCWLLRFISPVMSAVALTGRIVASRDFVRRVLQTLGTPGPGAGAVYISVLPLWIEANPRYNRGKTYLKIPFMMGEVEAPRLLRLPLDVERWKRHGLGGRIYSNSRYIAKAARRDRHCQATNLLCIDGDLLRLAVYAATPDTIKGNCKVVQYHLCIHNFA